MEASIYVGEGDDMDLELAKSQLPCRLHFQLQAVQPRAVALVAVGSLFLSRLPTTDSMLMGFPASIRTLQRQNEGLLTS